MKHPLHVLAERYHARKKQRTNHILADIVIIAVSFVIAIFLVRTHILTQILTSTSELELLGTFVAGMFFTSVFTTAPAIATLGEISLVQSVLLTAFVGALGSVLGDHLIFRFVRDRVAADVIELLREEGMLTRARKILKFKHFRWFTLLLGGFLIASPLPDEFGIAVLGFSRMNLKWFTALSFTFNFLGIYVIGLVAHALAG